MYKPSTFFFGTDKIASLLVKYNYQEKEGDILAGTILGIEKKQALVNLGLGYLTFLPKNEISSSQIETKELEKTKTGEFLIIHCLPKEKKLILSLRRLHHLKLWERFKQIDFKNMIFYTLFEKRIQGARVVNFDGLEVYLPNFHLPKYYRKISTKIKPIKVKVLEVREKNHMVIASAKLALLKKQSLILDLGLIQTTYVLKVKAFGIFLNIFGIKCLLHISEISDKKIENLHALYKKGDKICVKVIYINNQQGKIAVSAKI